MAGPRTPKRAESADERLERASAAWLREQRGRYPEELDARWLRDFGVRLTPLRPGEEKHAPVYITDALGVSYKLEDDTDALLEAGAVETVRQLALTDSQRGAEAFRQLADRLALPARGPGPRTRLRWNWHAVEAWYSKRLAENKKLRPRLQKFLARQGAYSDPVLVTRRPIFSTAAKERVTVNEGAWPHLEAETFVAARLGMSAEALRKNLKKHRAETRILARLRKTKRPRSR